MAQELAPLLTFHVEHIVAKQHGGGDELSNLALACHSCNLRKGPNLTGLDPATGRIEPLFNPRTQSWEEHFRLEDGWIIGLTPDGRTTLRVLAMNSQARRELRALG